MLLDESQIPHASERAGRTPTVLTPGFSSAIGRYGFTRGLDYASIVATSEKNAWTVDEIFRGRRFDASRTIVPAEWVGSARLSFLDEQDQVTLNHCRAFSYVHLLRNIEEHVADVAQAAWHGERAHLRALFRFGEEEMKHQELFRRAESVLEESCGHPFGRYFDDEKTKVTQLTAAFLGYSPLSRFLITLAFEWGTQRHYVESIRDQAADPLYADVLKAHWLEEAQHTKTDALEIARLAAEMSADEISNAFDDLLAIARIVDAAFVGQAERELATLESVSGRRLPNLERAVLRDALHRSMNAILGRTGFTHPRFAQVALELSAEGAAKVGIGMVRS